MNRLTPLGLTSICLLHYTSLASFGLPNNFVYGFMDCMLWIHDILDIMAVASELEHFNTVILCWPHVVLNFFICCIHVIRCNK